MAVRINKGTRVSKSVIINRAALTALGEGMADGLLAVGEKALALSLPNVPHDPAPNRPPGRPDLNKSGAFVVYIDKKKVGGNATLARVNKKGIVLYVGYGFPGRFTEIGTIKEHARPFLSPAFASAISDLSATLKPHVADRMRTVR